MAIYTKILKKDVVSIERKFNLGKITSFKGIKKGIENTNYLIRAKNNKYILTIFEKRVQKKDLPFFMSLMNKLNNHNINCPKPLKNNNGISLGLAITEGRLLGAYNSSDGQENIKLVQQVKCMLSGFRCDLV